MLKDNKSQLIQYVIERNYHSGKKELTMEEMNTAVERYPGARQMITEALGKTHAELQTDIENGRISKNYVIARFCI